MRVALYDLLLGPPILSLFSHYSATWQLFSHVFLYYLSTVLANSCFPPPHPPSPTQAPFSSPLPQLWLALSPQSSASSPRTPPAGGSSHRPWPPAHAPSEWAAACSSHALLMCPAPPIPTRSPHNSKSSAASPNTVFTVAASLAPRIWGSRSVCWIWWSGK